MKVENRQQQKNTGKLWL